MRGNVTSDSMVSILLGEKQSAGVWQDLELGWKNMADTTYEAIVESSTKSTRTLKTAKDGKTAKSTKIDKGRVPRPRKNPHAS